MNIVLTYSDHVTESYRGMSGRVKNPTPALESIEQVMIGSAQQNFIEQGRPDTWPGLAASTIKRRRNKDSSSILILRDTGYLMQSLSPAGNEYSVRELSQFRVSIGTNRPGATNHQEGVTLPQRRFLVHQEEDKETYKQHLTDFYLGRGPYAT